MVIKWRILWWIVDFCIGGFIVGWFVVWSGMVDRCVYVGCWCNGGMWNYLLF